MRITPIGGSIGTLEKFQFEPCLAKFTLKIKILSVDIIDDLVYRQYRVIVPLPYDAALP